MTDLSAVSLAVFVMYFELSFRTESDRNSGCMTNIQGQKWCHRNAQCGLARYTSARRWYTARLRVLTGRSRKCRGFLKQFCSHGSGTGQDEEDGAWRINKIGTPVVSVKFMMELYLKSRAGSSCVSYWILSLLNPFST